MRIPDYRVWVKKEKKMYGIEYDGFVDYIRACGEPNAFGSDVEIIDECGMYQSYSFDEVEVMEFVGLKDRNEKKIYEGDVCVAVINMKYGLVEKTGVLECDKLAFGVMLYFLPEKLDGMGLMEAIVTSGNGMAVIGNIYENPELLSK